MPRIVGLTGGIGSGKSTVSALWASQGAIIIDADAIARSAVSPGRPSHYLIRLLFGPHVFNNDKTLDRAALSRIVFNNKSARLRLNLVTHPFIILEMIARTLWNIFFLWKPIVVLDTPLLFESGQIFRKFCSKIVVVYCEVDQQVERTVARGGIDEKEAKKRIEAQMSLKEKCGLADSVIDNTSSSEDLEKRAMDTLEQLKPKLRNEILFRISNVLLASSVGFWFSRFCFR